MSGGARVSLMCQATARGVVKQPSVPLTFGYVTWTRADRACQCGSTVQFDASTSIGRLLFDHRLVCDVPPLPFLPSQKRMFVNGKQTSPSSLLRLPDGKGPIPGTMAAQVPHSDALECLPTHTPISAHLSNPLASLRVCPKPPVPPPRACHCNRTAVFAPR